MKFLFRTDSSNIIGSGHVMRCLTLAKALEVRGAECHFVCRDHVGNMAELIVEQGFLVHLLDSLLSGPVRETDKHGVDPDPYLEWLGATWQVDAAQTKQQIPDDSYDWLVVDHYGIDQSWETELRTRAKRIMVIDDMANREHDCDLLLDQNLVDGLLTRYRTLIPKDSACLLGPEFALLQSDYPIAHHSAAPRVGPAKRLLVYFGGADQKNLTGMAISAFQELDRNDIQLDVIINSRSPFKLSIQEQVEGLKNVTLYEDVPSLAGLMLKADLAIGGGGATCWERCCLGLPAYVVTLAENQVPIAKTLQAEGYVKWLGDANDLSIESLKSRLADALNNGNTLADWSTRCRSLVDGKGAERVAAILKLDEATQLRARPARLEDEALLLEWANDPLVRENAFEQELIEPETHRKWFYQRLRYGDRHQIFIVETEESVPLGQVRFDRGSDGWEISYSVARYARGRLLGRKVLELGIAELKKNHKPSLIIARVKLDN